MEPELPCQGKPLLAMDNDKQPVVISFHRTNPGEALLCGLAAVNDLSTGGTWVKQRYPDAIPVASFLQTRLVVITHSVLAGAQVLVGQNSSLTLFTMQALQANGEPGLLVKPYPNSPDHSPLEIKGSESHASVVAIQKHTGLSEEEELFFQNL